METKWREWTTPSWRWPEKETIQAQVRSACARGLAAFECAPAQGRTAQIVGTAPSLVRYLDDLTGDIFAINSAHDYLLEQGIVPKYFVTCDPKPGWRGAVTPHADVLYAPASSCHPELFDLLPAAQIRLWHAAQTWINQEAWRLGKLYWIANISCTTSAMQAFNLAYMAGYRRIEGYGLDSSFTAGEPYYVGGNRYSAPEPNNEHLQVRYNGRVFESELQFIQQCRDFEYIFGVLREDCELEIFGEGLLPWVASELNRINRVLKCAA